MFTRLSRRQKEASSSPSSLPSPSPSSSLSPSPRLDRNNAVRYNDDRILGGCCDLETRRSGLRSTGSLDLYGAEDNKVLRIDGQTAGQVEFLCNSLGLTGPDDFGIPIAAWEEQKVRSRSDLVHRSRRLDVDEDLSSTSPQCSSKLPNSVEDVAERKDEDGEKQQPEDISAAVCSVSDRGEKFDFAESVEVSTRLGVCDGRGNGGGIKGVRPPTLSPPPPISLPMDEGMTSAWDLIFSFAPRAENSRGTLRAGQCGSRDSSFPYDRRGQDEDERVKERVAEEYREVGRFSLPVGGDTGSGSFTTSNDDDCSSTTTDPFISPNGRWRCHIGNWFKVREIGRGSYGTVHEAISDDGVFFAVKEVSLFDQTNDAKQCVEQLEQEIGLLSEFEHENIVQYLGTEKGEGKLYIFLELVTQGSLASLYHKCLLWDSQVSAYTRQILNGLEYLHNRNVVHRDIKCSNILVAANGSVKLADFGLAKETSKFGGLNSCKGSVYWMAPEVIRHINGGYGSAADIWSLGCTVLEMLTRKPPNSDLEWAHAFYMIGRGLKPSIPDSLSRDAKDFISKCVQVNPDNRPTASELLDHPFVRRQLPTPMTTNSSSYGRRT